MPPLREEIMPPSLGIPPFFQKILLKNANQCQEKKFLENFGNRSIMNCFPGKASIPKWHITNKTMLKR
jgi:hypothetical protein